MATQSYLYTWGNNQFGQLGNNSTTPVNYPFYLDDTIWNAVSTGNDAMIAIEDGIYLGGIWTWGNNYYGQLGQNDTSARSVPTLISGTDSSIWKVVSAGAYSMAAIAADDTLWVWGDNANGQLGQSNLTLRSSPVQIGGTWKAIAVGQNMMLGIKSDDTLWAWGANDQGQLGLGDKDDRSAPVQVASATWIYVHASGKNAAAINNGNDLFVWGDNAFGQLAQDNTTDYSSMVQVQYSDWKKVSVGYGYICGIRNNGIDQTLWGWGKNNVYQLGQGDTDNRSNPVAITGFIHWNDISCGYATTLGLLNNPLAGGFAGGGQLYGWGLNTYGTIGNGTTDNVSLPIIALQTLNVWAELKTGSQNISNRAASAALGFAGNLIATPTPTPANTTPPPTPSPTPSPSISPTVTESPTPSPSISPTVTESPTPSPSISPTVTPSPTPSPSISPTVTESPTPSPSISPTVTESPTPSPSISPTVTESPTPSPSISPTVTPSPTPSPSISPTVTESPTPSPSISPTVTESPTPSPSISPTVTPSPTPSPSISPTVTESPTPSPSISPTVTESPTPSPSISPTVTESPTPSPSISPTVTESPTPSPSISPTVTESPTPSPSISPTVTPSPTPSPSISPTVTESPTPSPSISPTVTESPTPSPSESPTVTPSPTPSPSISPTVTESPTPSPSISPTVTESPTPSPSISPTVTESPTPSPSISPTVTESPTPSPSESPTVTPSPTPSPSISPTVTESPTPSPSISPTVTESPTPSPSISPTVTESPTPSPSPSPSNSPTPSPSPSFSPTPSASASPTPTPLPTIQCNGGSLWLWGDNTFGQIGDNTSGASAYKSSPVQTVSGGVDWCSHNLGGRHVLAIKLDGKVWSWGWNAYGQLGDNTTANRSSPVLAVNSSQWQQVAGGFDFSLALDDNDDLWSWGHNNKYQLGLGDTINRSSPTISPVSSNWVTIAAGYDHAAAIDTLGRIFCWGSNAYGQCGNPIAAPQITTPVEISLGGTNWEKVACGKYYTIALKDNGGIWAWGNNFQGQFGNSAVVNSDIPIQVQFSDWVNITTGGQFSAGIRWRLGPTPTPSFTPSPTPSGSATPTPTITPSVTPSATPTPTVGCVIEPLTIMAAYDPSALGNPCGDDEHKCDYASFTLTVNGVLLGIVNLNNRSDGGPRVVNFGLSSLQVNTLANLDPEQDLFFHFTCNTQCGVACGPVSPTNFCTYDYNPLTDSWALTSSAVGPDCGCYSPTKLQLLYDLFGLSTFTIPPQKFARGTNGWCLSRTTANWLVDSYDGCHDGTVWLSITGDDTGKIYHDGCYSRGVTINICDPKPTTTPSPSPSVTSSPTPSPSESPAPTNSPTPSSTAPTPTPSGTEATPSPTASPTPSGTEPTATPTPSPSQSPSNTPSPTPSPSISPTATPTPTPTECAIAFSTANILYSQSSVYYTNQPATNAVMNDGNFEQTLQTGTDGGGFQWIQMDLQCVFRVTSVIVGCDFNNTLAGNWGPTYTAGQDVQYSFDGITWYFMFNTGNFTQGIQSYPTDINCRYIRIINSKSGFLAVTQFTIGVTASPTTTASPTPSGTQPTPTITPSPSQSPSNTPSPTPSPSQSPSNTPSPTPSNTGPTPTPTNSPTASATPLPTPLPISGYLWGCGYGFTGVLGRGSLQEASSLVQTIYSTNDWMQLNTSLSFSTIAIKNDGSLWTWGYNQNGQVGNGTTDNQLTPITPLSASGIKFVQSAAGLANMAAIADDGDVYIAGDGQFGQQGVGFLTASLFYRNVYNFESNRSSIGPAKYVVQGRFNTFIINGFNKLFAAGLNDGGQLSTGNINNTSVYVQINSDNSWLQVSSTYRTTAAIRDDNTLWLWGSNVNGSLGQNLDETQLQGASSPVQVVGGGSWIFVSVGQKSVYAIKSDTSIWAWGQNSYGKLGDSSVFDRSSPVQIDMAPNTGWIQVSGGSTFAAARKSNGSVYAWGQNILGQLGPQLTNNNISKPTQMQTGSIFWTSMSAGYRNVQLLTLETPAPTSSPTVTPSPTPSPSVTESPTPSPSASPTPTPSASGTPLPTSTPFPTIPSTGANLWLWGENNYGQIGDGTTIFRSSPVQTLLFGRVWGKISMGAFHGTGILTDQTLWTWGRNNFGQLGQQSLINTSSPAQTITLSSNWYSVAAGYNSTGAIKYDGTLWMWGYNTLGTLGDNTTVNRSSPVLTYVGGTTWQNISIGRNHSGGIKEDGTLWMWGGNANGQLGNNSTVSLSSAVQTFVNSTDWANVYCGDNFTIAIKSDGEIWGWGLNSTGQFGNETYISNSVPTQVIGYSSTWTAAAAGSGFSGALGNFNPPPTMSPSPSATVTPTPTPPTTSPPTPSPSPSGTAPTMTPTMSPTPSGTEPTMTPTPSPSESASPTPSPSESASPTPSPSESASPTPSASLSPTPTGTEATMTPTPSPSISASATATPAPSGTGGTPTPTPQPTQQGYYLYLWGNNAYGQLSQNNLTNTSFPTQILGNTKLWTGVSTGTNIAGATKTDGSLWVWGSNFAGQLANETTVSASSLIQVITGVSQWVQISAGQNTMGGIAKPN